MIIQVDEFFKLTVNMPDGKQFLLHCGEVITTNEQYKKEYDIRKLRPYLVIKGVQVALCLLSDLEANRIPEPCIPYFTVLKSISH